MTARSRYGLRYGATLFGWCVEVTAPTQGLSHPDRVRVLVDYDEVVTRKYGFTPQHAMSRAIAWTRKHGDPR
jgi:hypothetical protein